MADPETYRDKAEVEQHRSTDPIEGFKRRLLDGKLADEADFERIDNEIEEQLEAAVKFADDSPVPDPETMYDYIYDEPARNNHGGESPRG
jgi:pyruvate dehydrogenase E1 component alpha subunit